MGAKVPPLAVQTFGYPSDTVRMPFGVQIYPLAAFPKLPSSDRALHKVPVGEPARQGWLKVQELR